MNSGQSLYKWNNAQISSSSKVRDDGEIKLSTPQDSTVDTEHIELAGANEAFLLICLLYFILVTFSSKNLIKLIYLYMIAVCDRCCFKYR